MYASQWQLGNQKLWTFINRQEQWAIGKLLEETERKGIKYMDLITGKEAKTTVENGKVSVFVELSPKAIGGILVLPESELTPELDVFLKKQAVIYQKTNFSTAYQLPKHILKPVVSTKKYAKVALPKGMKIIPVPSDSATMTFSFRQREGGFYPLGNFVDYAYSQDRNELIKGNVTVKLRPFAMDETLVTNAQFTHFLKVSNYKPTHSENFLKHWVNNAPPQGQENH